MFFDWMKQKFDNLPTTELMYKEKRDLPIIKKSYNHHLHIKVERWKCLRVGGGEGFLFSRGNLHD